MKLVKKQNFDLLGVMDASNELIKKAKKNNNSLKGTNFYAKKFLEESVTALKILESIKGNVRGIVSDDILEELTKNVQLFFNLDSKNKIRRTCQQQILSIFKVQIQPNLNKKITHELTDDFFPLELLSRAKPYLKKIAEQSLGCYDLGWYDACAVMIRRLLETLIIECFESQKISDKIKKDDDNFFYLSDLISKFLSECGTSWNPSRNCKKGLPNLKDIGDKSAHSRFFTARKPDLDEIKKDLRTIIEELISISESKKD